MKVIQNFVVINVCFNHFNEKVCWTSKIHGENPWKKCDICCLFWCTSRRCLVFIAWRKLITKTCHIFSRIFSKDFWSSANFFIEIVDTNIDHHKKRKRLCFIENVRKEFESYANQGHSFDMSPLTSFESFLSTTILTCLNINDLNEVLLY